MSHSANKNISQPSRKLNIALWLVQILLAALYGAAGFMKTMQPIPELAAMMHWPGDVPVWLVRFIGAAEIAGAIGLIVPSAFRVFAWLTPLAACGLALIQILAIPFHIIRGELFILPVSFVLLALAVFVAKGRWR